MQAVSWVQTTLVKALNFYYTNDFMPSEKLVIQIIKDAYREVRIVATQNNLRPYVCKLPLIKDFKRPRSVNPLGVKICEYRNCHSDINNHRIQELQTLIYEKADDSSEAHQLENIIFKHLTAKKDKDRNKLEESFIKGYLNKQTSMNDNLDTLLYD